jgi:hypothetical protein
VISTRDLSALPDIDPLRATLQSMALLDAILQPEWEYRYYSFNCHWGGGHQLASMRNGQGDDFFAVFGPAGCFLKGFAHEAVMSPYGRKPKAVWPGVLEAVPTEFADYLNEPAFTLEDTTFCVWRRYGEPFWSVGAVSFPAGQSDPDGSAYLLSPLDGEPATYQVWAEGYYGRAVPLAAVRHVYKHRPLSARVVKQLNPAVGLEDLRAQVDEIGYRDAAAQS